MITLPTKFELHYRRAGGTQAVVVAFYNTNFTNFHYAASTRDMQVSTVHVHSHLLNITGINEKIDVHTKKWATSDITITLLNPQYSPAGGGVRDRLSEGTEPSEGSSLTDWLTVRVYLVCGENSIFTTDGILRFEGRIVGVPIVTEKTITVKAQVMEREKHKILPTEIVGTTYSDAPAENLEKRVPIVYGEFTENYWNELTQDGDLFSGNGLTKALRVDSASEPKYVISDHILYSATDDAFINVGVSLPARADVTTVTLNDSGHGTIVWTFGGATYRTGYHPHRKYIRQMFVLNDDVPGYAMSWLAYNQSEAHDFDTGVSSNVVIRDSYEDGPATGFWGLVAFGINEEALLRESIQSFALAYPGWRGYINLAFYKWVKAAARTAAGAFYGSLLWGPSGVGEINVDQTYFATSMVPAGFYDRDGWSSIRIGHCSSVDFENTDEDDGGVTRFTLVVGNKISSEWDSDGLNNDNLAVVRELRLELHAQIENAPLEMWVECKGREYGSWITESSRSIDNKASGDLIENQAHIIESILRDELGIATADIDTASFDSAYNSATAGANRVSRLNIYKEISSAKAIRELAEQSTFAFTWTAAGKAKLIPLHSSYWSSKNIDSTILWSHIKAGSLKISKTKIYCNEVEAQSRWHGETGLFRGTDKTSDSGSQTSYGTWRRSAKWPSLAGSARSHVANQYVNSTNGLWSRPHLTMECETLGFTNAHLELGDCIKLDSTTVDPHLKAYAESWSGPKLCIIELQQTMTGTKIKAIELF